MKSKMYFTKYGDLQKLAVKKIPVGPFEAYVIQEDKAVAVAPVAGNWRTTEWLKAIRVYDSKFVRVYFKWSKKTIDLVGVQEFLDEAKKQGIVFPAKGPIFQRTGGWDSFRTIKEAKNKALEAKYAVAYNLYAHFPVWPELQDAIDQAEKERKQELKARADERKKAKADKIKAEKEKQALAQLRNDEGELIEVAKALSTLKKHGLKVVTVDQDTKEKK